MSDKGKISSLLNVGHFGKTGDGPASADPLQETKIEVTLDEVRAYDHNPRQSENDRFEEIKTSIRTTGRLKSTLHVTRRPGDKEYIISAGGNTRLQALRELWEETGDERFYRFSAVFEPWESEARVLTDHLIENDLRADLNFIDQALALRKLREELEREAGEKLSLRRFETALRKLGYAKSISLLSRMDYAVDVLWPLIPRSLSAGMGFSQIVKFRSLHKGYRDVWEINAGAAQANDASFVRIFEESLRALDETGFDFDAFQGTMNHRLAELFRLPGPHYIAQGLENALHGLRNDDFKFPQSSDGEPPLRMVAVPPPRQPVSPRMPQARSGAPTTGGPGASTAPERPITPEVPAGSQSEIFTNGDGDQQSSQEAWDVPPLQDLDALRHQAFQAAQRFAAAVSPELEPCILPYDEGLGYLVELPGRSFNGTKSENKDEDPYQLMALNIAWWTLASLSEVVLLDQKRFKYLPEHYLYAKWVLKDPNLIHEYVGIPQYHSFGKILQNRTLFNALDEMRDLMQIGQQIRGQVDDKVMGWSLWPSVFPEEPKQ